MHTLRLHATEGRGGGGGGEDHGDILFLVMGAGELVDC